MLGKHTYMYMYVFRGAHSASLADRGCIVFTPDGTSVSTAKSLMSPARHLNGKPSPHRVFSRSHEQRANTRALRLLHSISVANIESRYIIVVETPIPSLETSCPSQRLASWEINLRSLILSLGDNQRR